MNINKNEVLLIISQSNKLLVEAKKLGLNFEGACAILYMLENKSATLKDFKEMRLGARKNVGSINTVFKNSSYNADDLVIRLNTGCKKTGKKFFLNSPGKTLANKLKKQLLDK